MIMEMNAGSPKLQPLYSRSQDWRSSLAVGDPVYVLVKKGKWAKGVIVPMSSLPKPLVGRSTDAAESVAASVNTESENSGEGVSRDDENGFSLLVQLRAPGDLLVDKDVAAAVSKPIYKVVGRYSDEISPFLLPLPRQKGPNDPLTLLAY
jgi:hypothetical protein